MTLAWVGAQVKGLTVLLAATPLPVLTDIQSFADHEVWSVLSATSNVEGCDTGAERLRIPYGDTSAVRCSSRQLCVWSCQWGVLYGGAEEGEGGVIKAK